MEDSCLAYYDALTHEYKLAKDDGRTWPGGVSVGLGSVSNGQCTVGGGTGAFAGHRGSELEVDFPIQFDRKFTGTKVIYMAIQNADRYTFEWRKIGEWSVR